MSMPAIVCLDEPAYTGPGAPPPVATANAAKTATAAIPMPGKARHSGASRVCLMNLSPSDRFADRDPLGPTRYEGSGRGGGDPRRRAAGVGPAVGRGPRLSSVPRPSLCGPRAAMCRPLPAADERANAVGQADQRPCDRIAGEGERDLEKEAWEERRLEHRPERCCAGVKQRLEVLLDDEGRRREERERQPCCRSAVSRPCPGGSARKPEGDRHRRQ